MLGLYGGTFDPPHLGHSECALSAAKECGINRLQWLPCAQSPLKPSIQASNQQRNDMLRLLCREQNNRQREVRFSVNDLEFGLPSPSYTVDTLAHIRQNSEINSPLCFFMGEDSLYTLPKWKNWQSLTEYCHIVVLRRDVSDVLQSEVLDSWLRSHITNDADLLHQKQSGFVYLSHTPLKTISSTELRMTLKHEPSYAKKWLSPDVFKYICENKLYRN